MPLLQEAAPEDTAMSRYALGDDTAFSELYDALAPRLHGFLRRHAGGRSLAEDLLQQTFLHLHRSRGRFAPGAEVAPWAFAIARRLCIDATRHRRRHADEQSVPMEDVAQPHASLDSSPEEAFVAAEASACIDAALDRLPETQRTAFDLVKRDGLSFQQAAAVLGVTVAAVKLRAHRAYDALHAALDARGPRKDH